MAQAFRDLSRHIGALPFDGHSLTTNSFWPERGCVPRGAGSAAARPIVDRYESFRRFHCAELLRLVFDTAALQFAGLAVLLILMLNVWREPVIQTPSLHAAA
jgi:hypothetical protein